MGSSLRSGTSCIWRLLLSVFPAVPGTGPLSCLVELTSVGDHWANCRPPWSSPSVYIFLSWRICLFSQLHKWLVGGVWGFCVCRLCSFISFKQHPDQPLWLTSETVRYWSSCGWVFPAALQLVGFGSGTSMCARQQMATDSLGCVPCR